MTRRIIFIILSAVAFALLVGLIWFFFFRAAGTPPANTGSFGTGTAKTGTTGTTNNKNNVPSGVLPNGSNTGAPVSGGSGNTANGGSSNVLPGGVPGIDSVPGVDWLGGGSAGTGGGPTTSFVPKTINDLNSGIVSGSPYIMPGGNVDNGNGGGNGFLGTALLGVGIGTALCTAGLLPGVLTGSGVAVGANVVGAGISVPVYDASGNLQAAYGNTLKTNDTLRENFLNCITRTIARAAVQQITASVVNWINSGFNGKPSFVTNYQQFFTNVADQAAGEFIRGSALSFLCTPFRAQIRIAVAQSYARRNAQSCTLSGVIKNINSFMNGNFSQGGWGGFLAFTSIPTNNPFGAYQDGVAKLSLSVSSAVGRKQEDYIIGKGFLSSEKKVNCKEIPLPADQYGPPQTKCDTVVTTPGSTISDSLSKTLGVSQDTLTQAGISGSFDAIIGALISQLMVKALQGGVSNLSGTNGYAANYLTPEQQKAQTDAQALLTDMQGRATIAQQYGSVMQGAIADIQNAQAQLQGLANCYESKGKSDQASSTLEIISSYNVSVDMYNANITKANQSIALLQDLQTRAIGVTSAADVAAVSADYQSALASGAIITQTDVTQAQQDRATLQSNLDGHNSATAAALQQCNAL